MTYSQETNSHQNQARIMVVDDDPITRQTLGRALQREGNHVIECEDGMQMLSKIDESVDAILLDLYMPILDGMQCMHRLRENGMDLPIIMVTSETEARNAVSAMKEGAFDYLTKPVDVEELVSTVDKAVRTAQLLRENQQLRRALSEPVHEVSLVGESTVSIDLLNQIEKMARLDSTVMLTGESGTGKSLIARMIHKQGPHSNQPFITVNCTALPRELVESELFGHEKGAFTGAHQQRMGRIEMAAGGTLFLDEIGDMPMDLQPKLLTFLQERTFQRIGGGKDIHAEVRVICATNQNLKQMVTEKKFREDLFFRLNVLPLRIPALRERISDLPLLVRHLLDQIASGRHESGYQIADDAKGCLINYAWPGNIRELRNVLERASAFCENSIIRLNDMPNEVRNGHSLEDLENSDCPAMQLAGMTLKEIERLAIEQTLEYCRGNKARAARELGISEKSIYNKMDRLGMTRRLRSQV